MYFSNFYQPKVMTLHRRLQQFVARSVLAFYLLLAYLCSVIINLKSFHDNPKSEVEFCSRSDRRIGPLPTFLSPNFWMKNISEKANECTLNVGYFGWLQNSTHVRRTLSIGRRRITVQLTPSLTSLNQTSKTVVHST